MNAAVGVVTTLLLLLLLALVLLASLASLASLVLLVVVVVVVDVIVGVVPDMIAIAIATIAAAAAASRASSDISFIVVKVNRYVAQGSSTRAAIISFPPLSGSLLIFWVIVFARQAVSPLGHRVRASGPGRI